MRGCCVELGVGVSGSVLGGRVWRVAASGGSGGGMAVVGGRVGSKVRPGEVGRACGEFVVGVERWGWRAGGWVVGWWWYVGGGGVVGGRDGDAFEGSGGAA